MFPSFSGLKPNISKFEICGLGPLKGAEIAVSGIQSVDLKRDAIKILNIYFSYNINLINQKNYCKAIISIHSILKLWRMRNLSIEDKIVVFKTLTISKLVYLVFLTVIPNHITVYLKIFSTKNINFITQLFNTDGSVQTWNIFKTEYVLQNKDQFCWLQLITAIPEIWKNVSNKHQKILVCW